MEYAYIYDTEIGKMRIVEDEQGITELSWVVQSEENEKVVPSASCEYKETELIKEAAKQLMEYLEGKRKEFTVRLHPKGTPFQIKVWQALSSIPYGETRSYKQIAEAVGNSKASRAVGRANHNNPIVCIIPCHRVIGSDKSLVGYGGGLEIKVKLLQLENIAI